MKTSFPVRSQLYGLAVGLLLTQSACSSVLQASRMSIPESTVSPVDESVLERANRFNQTSSNPPSLEHYGMERTLPSPGYLLSVGFQWVFVPQNTQSAGHWVALSAGREIERP